MTDLLRLKKVIKWLIYMEYAETQDELAQHLGYSKSSFSQLVNGKVHLSGKFISKLCDLDPNINKNWIKSGEGDIFINQFEKRPECLQGIPLISIESIPSFSNSPNQKYDLYDIPEFNQKGATYAIRMSGNEMNPMFLSGDILACKKIAGILFPQYGKVYIIETSQEILIKRVYQCEDEDFITCVSENKTEYPPFKLLKSDIQGYSLILGLIHIL